MTHPLTVAEFVALREAVGWGSADKATIRAAFERTLAWAVERTPDGRLLGCARAVGDGIYVLVVDVMVDPVAQGTGVGRRLVDRLLTDPVVAAARHITLFAAPEVAGFYEASGAWEPQTGTYFRARD